MLWMVLEEVPMNFMESILNLKEKSISSRLETLDKNDNPTHPEDNSSVRKPKSRTGGIQIHLRCRKRYNRRGSRI